MTVLRRRRTILLEGEQPGVLCCLYFFLFFFVFLRDLPTYQHEISQKSDVAAARKLNPMILNSNKVRGVGEGEEFLFFEKKLKHNTHTDYVAVDDESDPSGQSGERFHVFLPSWEKESGCAY
jgi:hypothetical protein